MSIRIPERTVEIDGEKYTLRCNMAVLERLQDEQDGDIGALIQMPTYKAVFLILKAMLDEDCEDRGVPEVQMKRLKKLFSPADVADWGVFRMFVESMAVQIMPPVSDPDTGANAAAPENSGN